MRGRVPGFVLSALGAIVFVRAVPVWIGGWLGSDDQIGAAAPGIPWVPVAAVVLAIGVTAVACYLFAAAVVLSRGEGTQARVVGLALVFVGFGVTDALALLRASDPVWTVPVLAVGNAANALALAVLLTFPTGRFVPRWSATLLLGWTAYLVLMLAIPSLRWESLGASAVIVELAVFAIAVAAQCYRFANRSTQGERQRTKWILLAFLIMFPAAIVRDVPPLVMPALATSGTVERFVFDVIRTVYWDVAAAFAAVAIALATIRYHLLDVDLAINRTIVATLLTAIVAGLFTGISAITNWVILGVTGQHSEVANIAVAVLVAVCIAPLQRVVRRHVDRALEPSRST